MHSNHTTAKKGQYFILSTIGNKIDRLKMLTNMLKVAPDLACRLLNFICDSCSNSHFHFQIMCFKTRYTTAYRWVGKNIDAEWGCLNTYFVSISFDIKLTSYSSPSTYSNDKSCDNAFPIGYGSTVDNNNSN